MPEVSIGLWCTAGFLAVGVLGAAVGRFSFATSLIYGLALAVSLVVLSLALTVLLSST